MLLALLMIAEQSFSQEGKDKQLMDSNKVVTLVERIKYEVLSGKRSIRTIFDQWLL